MNNAGVISEGKVLSPEGVADALDELYINKEHRYRVAEACYRRATQPEYQWENIGKRWHEVFQEVLNN